MENNVAVELSQNQTTNNSRLKIIKNILREIKTVADGIFRMPYHVLTAVSYSAGIFLYYLFLLISFILKPFLLIIKLISKKAYNAINNFITVKILGFLLIDHLGHRLITSIFRFIFTLMLMIVLCYWIGHDGLWESAMDFIEQIGLLFGKNFGNLG